MKRLNCLSGVVLRPSVFAVECQHCKQLCSSGTAGHRTVELHVKDVVIFLIDRYDVTDYGSLKVYVPHEKYT